MYKDVQKILKRKTLFSDKKNRFFDKTTQIFLTVNKVHLYRVDHDNKYLILKNRTHIENDMTISSLFSY